MCFGGKPKVDNSALDFQKEQAARARAEEQARQARIAEGMNQIASIFDGGEYRKPVGEQEVGSKISPEWQAWQDAGGVQTVTQKFAKGDREREVTFSAPEPQKLISAVEGKEIGDMIPTYETRESAGMQPVLDQRREALTEFLVPQLEDQYEDATDDLTFSLARSGQLNSSTAGTRGSDLAQAFALNRADVDSTIQGDVANTRSRMNQQRQSLEAALRASGDQTATTNNALATAGTFRQETPSLSPLPNVFQGLSTGIGAAQQGYESGRLRKMATPNPLGGGTGRVVRG